MAPAAKGQGSNKHQLPKEKQDTQIAKRLKHAPNAKLLKQFEKVLYDLEQGQDSPVLVKAEAVKNKALQEENMRLKTDLELARNKIRDLEKAKNDLTSDLLKQKPKSQLSDSHIAEMYQQLRESISAWVDKEVTKFEDLWRHNHEGVYPNFSFFRDGENPEYATFLANNYKLGGEHLVQSVLQAKLQQVLFSNDNVFFALLHTDAIFLRTVEEGLSRLDPPRDPMIVKYLRSEVLKGFTAAPGFERTLQKLKPKIGQEIYNAASIILPLPPCEKERRHRFDCNVLEPAFKLAIDMMTSATEYLFAAKMTEETQFAHDLLDPERFSDRTMIDVNTREILKPERLVGSKDSITVVWQVLLLAPRLLSRTLGEAEKCLVPSAVCVEVDHVVPDTEDRPLAAHRCWDRKTPEVIACVETAMKAMSTLSGQRAFESKFAVEKAEAARTLEDQPRKRTQKSIELDKLFEDESEPRQHITKVDKAEVTSVPHEKTTRNSKGNSEEVIRREA
ncbi:MAG: hypothetical protein Q9188_006403 [Gyalolechia gomerana]